VRQHAKEWGVESNKVGVHEFAQWCQSAGTEMMLAINLGSRGLDHARNFVEYVNGPTGSAPTGPAEDCGEVRNDIRGDLRIRLLKATAQLRPNSMRL